MGYLLGLDIGTSSVKAAIINKDGKTITIERSSGHTFSCLHGGWAEEDPVDWWVGCQDTIAKSLISGGISAGEIDCIGLSAQMHSLVPLDENFELVRTSILHCDSRSGRQAKNLRALLQDDHIMNNIVKNPIHTGYTLPSLLWVRENEPDVYKSIRHIMLPADYIRFRLTGEYGTDHSDASATLAYDYTSAGWSELILNMVNVPVEFFPKIYNSAEIAGTITKKAEKETGLRAGTPVVFGGADQVMQSIGCGSIEQGQATVNIGSSTQVCLQINNPISSPKKGINCFCSYKSDKWYLMGANTNGGSTFKWFCNEILQNSDLSAIDNQVSSVMPGCNGLVFLPYLSGERCPHLNADISGVFWGLSYLTDRARMARAVMEGIVFSMYNCLLICETSGITPEVLIAIGGGAGSKVWLQIQADIYGRPLTVTASSEQAVLGAAITAGVGCGAFSSFAEGCKCTVHYKDIIEPNLNNHKKYLEYFKIFNDIYSLALPALEAVTVLGRNDTNEIAKT